MQFTNQDVEPVEPTADPEIIDAVISLRQADRAVAEAEDRKAKARDTLVGLLRARGEKSTWVDCGDGLVRATVVQPERTQVDAEGLRKAIGARAFNKIAAQRVDTTKLQQAISKGTIDLATAADFITVTRTSAYIRISEAEGEL